MKKGKIIRWSTDALLVFLAIAAVAMYLNLFLYARANAEEAGTDCWVLCMPDSCVNIREQPGVGSRQIGAAVCGAQLTTDGTKRGEFVHLVNVPAEETTGWISSRYITTSQPREVGTTISIKSDGRVACRKWIGGKITGWAHNGDRIYVYWMSSEWAVTERGYIRAEYLQIAG